MVSEGITGHKQQLQKPQAWPAGASIRACVHALPLWGLVTPGWSWMKRWDEGSAQYPCVCSSPAFNMHLMTSLIIDVNTPSTPELHDCQLIVEHIVWKDSRWTWEGEQCDSEAHARVERHEIEGMSDARWMAFPAWVALGGSGR